ncbi:LbetaH domain-containing protein [Methanosphaerula palustris]|uniref:Serine O-acetyltransferase n=1 Tax=Methanosphaerula palustris (strain ATCC BAA-1556 / DSM 19958 / E1-9c) TaxID=521011 RepID=B8GFA9_METPE|nr:serine O-acetyltransferase [Methanosphaerula palustris]ACL15957.1 serine O-acetyltransferase [Methanosphaerula palustris E1-9c]
MIRSKDEYLFYLEADRVALNRQRKRPKLFGDEIWRFQRLLRTVEFYENCRTSLFWKPFLVYYSIMFRLFGLLLGYTIPQHVFGPGLAITSVGTIVVNSCVRVGENCRLHVCVNIGSRAGTDTEAPQIGNNVCIGPGAVLFGQISIADNITIGANAVVTRSFTEEGILIAGAPAKKIECNGSVPAVKTP